MRFKSLDELATIYCNWAEMHLRHRNYESALQIMEHACTANRPSKRKSKDQDAPKSTGPSLFNNLKCWSLYLDLMVALGKNEQARAGYERVMELKIATPQIVLNYAKFLQDQNYYEDSYRVYERALQIFPWPHAHELWCAYLYSIISRYAECKVDRIRDLFEQVLKGVPQKQAKLFFYMYADFEENFGLLNHAMQIYDRASKELTKEDIYEVLNVSIAMTSEFYGVSRTREMYEKALQRLSGADRVQMGLRFAKIERKLGEIERARAIYQHLSQFCNPKIKDLEEKFWNLWEKFEIYHGNEDTYKDFMRTKRTVELKYSVAAVPMSILEQDKPSIDFDQLEKEGEGVSK